MKTEITTTYIADEVQEWAILEPTMKDFPLECICSQCPAGAWQITNSKTQEGSRNNIKCLCTKLKITSFEIGMKETISSCTLQKTSLQEYTSRTYQ